MYHAAHDPEKDWTVVNADGVFVFGSWLDKQIALDFAAMMNLGHEINQQHEMQPVKES